MQETLGKHFGRQMPALVVECDSCSRTVLSWTVDVTETVTDLCPRCAEVPFE